MNHPVFSVRVMPILGPDRWIPVLPWTVWIYFSLWIYICIPFSLMGTRQTLVHYFQGALALSILGFLIFICMLTAVPEWSFEWNSYSMLAFLKQSDASGNACPSLHVGFAVFAGFWLNRTLKDIHVSKFWNWGNSLWAGAIIISTMTTKQHVFIDVVAGSLLSLGVCASQQWWLRKQSTD
jgi:hypothetical protein